MSELNRTGNLDLDSDIEDFCNFDDAALQRFNKAAEQSDAPQVLVHRIPLGIIRLATTLANPERFAKLQSKVSQGASKRLVEVRDRISRLLPKLAAIPIDFRQGLLPANDVDLPYKQIAGVASMSSFRIQEGTLEPSLQLAFVDPSRKVVLESTGGWDDWAFVASAIIGYVRKEMESAQSLIAENKVDVRSFSSLRHHMDQLIDETTKLTMIIGSMPKEKSDDRR